MTQEQLASINCTFVDDSYVNHHNGNHEERYIIKSPRLHRGFIVYRDLEKLDFQEIKNREISAYAYQLFKSHESLLRNQLEPFYRKIAEGTNLEEITAVIKIPTK